MAFEMNDETQVQALHTALSVSECWELFVERKHVMLDYVCFQQYCLTFTTFLNYVCSLFRCSNLVSVSSISLFSSAHQKETKIYTDISETPRFSIAKTIYIQLYTIVLIINLTSPQPLSTLFNAQLSPMKKSGQLNTLLMLIFLQL